MDEEVQSSTDKFTIKIDEKTGSITNSTEKCITYVVELVLSDKILSIRFGLPNEAEKYRNNYTIEKLLHKAPKLAYFFQSVKQLRDQLSDYLTKKQFELQIYEEKYFTYLKFSFNLFENPIHNFDLQLFLYKSDNNYSRLLINDLTEKLEIVIDKNKELRERQSNIFNKLKNIKEDNKIIVAQIDSLYENQSKNLINLLDEIKENSEIRINDIENNVSNIKNEIINSGEELRRSNKYVFLPILRTEDKKMLQKWFNQDFELILAYDSSKHGDSATVFHQKCDGKIQTLTLVETENGKRFGGYSKLTWDSTENFKSGDSTAFIFSLDKHIHLPIEDTNYVTFCSCKSGPKFGKHDIVISDEFTKNYNSYSCVFNSYGKKDNFVGSNVNSSSLLAGIEFFKVRKIEVFQVIFK